MSTRGGQTGKRGATLRRGTRECYYCGALLIDAPGHMHRPTIDHRTPLSRGGTNAIGNLVVACFSCNNAKDRMTEREFRAKFPPDALRARHERIAARLARRAARQQETGDDD